MLHELQVVAVVEQVLHKVLQAEQVPELANWPIGQTQVVPDNVNPVLQVKQLVAVVAHVAQIELQIIQVDPLK